MRREEIYIKRRCCEEMRLKTVGAFLYFLPYLCDGDENILGRSEDVFYTYEEGASRCEFPDGRFRKLK